MSAWKELQLALQDDSKTEEDLVEYERNWTSECRRDYINDLKPPKEELETDCPWFLVVVMALLITIKESDK